MPTFLCKTEPNDYSFDDLVRDKRTVWDGVANPTACIHIRSIKPGDELLIYHTGNHKHIAGLARAISDPYADPERPDLTAKGDVKFPVVDIEPIRGAKTPATLADIKADGRFVEFELVTQSRLSVMPVPARIDKALRKMAGL